MIWNQNLKAFDVFVADTNNLSFENFYLNVIHSDIKTNRALIFIYYSSKKLNLNKWILDVVKINRILLTTVETTI